MVNNLKLSPPLSGIIVFICKVSIIVVCVGTKVVINLILEKPNPTAIKYLCLSNINITKTKNTRTFLIAFD